MRSMVATFIMASWEAGDAKEKEGRKETIYLREWGGTGNASVCCSGAAGERRWCVLSTKNAPARSQVQGPHVGPGHGPGSSFGPRTSPLAS